MRVEATAKPPTEMAIRVFPLQRQNRDLTMLQHPTSTRAASRDGANMSTPKATTTFLVQPALAHLPADFSTKGAIVHFLLLTFRAYIDQETIPAIAGSTRRHPARPFYWRN